MESKMKKLIIFIILVSFALTTALTACGNTQPAPAQGTQETPANDTDSGAVDTNPDETNQPAADPAAPEPAPPAEEPPPAAPQEPPEFALIYKDTLIEMDQDMTYVLEKLGEPLGVFEAPSCAFDGIDRIFSYPGIQIHTYPKGDDDYVHTISLRDDSVRT